MSTEIRAELPPGFSWREVPQLRAAFTMPDGWVFRYENAFGTQACFITRESILAERFSTSPEGVRQQVQEGKGYKTGLSVNSFEAIAKKLGVSPAIFARSALTTNSFLIPEGRLEISQDGPLHIQRGYFRSGNRLLASRGMPPIKYYMETVGNNQTDRAYVLMFETPAELWEQDRNIAEVVINNRVLDPTL